MRNHHVSHAFSYERGPAGQELIGNEAKGIDVHSSVEICLRKYLFRRHIVRRPHTFSSLGLSIAERTNFMYGDSADDARDPKIRQYGMPVVCRVNEHILGL